MPFTALASALSIVMDIDYLLQQARSKCQQAGGKLTEKRAQLLELLLQAQQPLSAYELLQDYQQRYHKTLQPMSAYRMLDFFVQVGVVHKLTSTNKYLACAHIGCAHVHQRQHFLVCQRCGQTKEITLAAELLAQLSDTVKAAGFELLQPQLELECLCESCAAMAKAEA